MKKLHGIPLLAGFVAAFILANSVCIADAPTLADLREDLREVARGASL